MNASPVPRRSTLIRAAVQRSIIDSGNEYQLYQFLCDICVTLGGYRMAWFGIAEDDPAKTVRPVAVAGHNDGYVQQCRFTWDESGLGLGPTGTSIRTANPCINWDWTRVSNHRLDPWRKEALRRGFASSIALPLVIDGQAIGALTLYSSEKAQLGDGELLASIMSELAAAVKQLRPTRTTP